MKEHWTYRLSLGSTGLAGIVSVGLFLATMRSLPPAIPLWFSRPWGSDQLAHPLWLLVLPGASVVIFFLNSLFSIKVIPDHPTFIRILLLTSALVSMLSLIAMAQILSLVL